LPNEPVWRSIAPNRIAPTTNVWTEIRGYNLQRLCHSLASQTTVVFTGAGCSQTCGLLSWSDLYEKIRKKFSSKLSSELRNGLRKASSAEIPLALDLIEAAVTPKRLHEAVVKALTPSARSSTGNKNAYAEIVELPVRRFMTTNYDDLLEKAIKKAVTNESCPTFTQRGTSFLPRFAVALANQDQYMVFYCHGRLGSEDIILTEGDYKRWYLSERHEAMSFRLLLDVTLLSNPMLFIGYGLGDPDLLQSLRSFTATQQPGSKTSDVFALVSDNRKRLGELQFRSFQSRYGINVIDFKGFAWARELRRLKRNYLQERELWRMQPKGRQLKPDPNRYSLQPHSPKDPLFAAATINGDPLNKELKAFLQDADRRVLIISGEVGSGKYVRVSQLLSVSKKEKGAARFVFFSAHDTDDIYLYLKKVVVAAEKLACHSSGADKTLVERLGAALDKGLCVILSGMDRFFRRDQDPPNTLATDLLKMLNRDKSSFNSGKLIVTTRFDLPEPKISGKIAANGVALAANGVALYEAKLGLGYAKTLGEALGIKNRHDTSRLLNVVGSNYAGFVIASTWLGKRDVKSHRRELDEMGARVSGATAERASRVVRFVLRRLAQEFKKRLDYARPPESVPIDSLEQLLTLLSCMTRPFNELVASEACQFLFGLRLVDSLKKRLLNGLLVQYRLVEVVCAPKRGLRLYTVSAAVRRYCRSRRLGSAVREVRAFGLHGYTSRGNFVDAGAHETVRKFLERLIESAEREIKKLQGVQGKDRLKRRKPRTLVRAAFDVLRSNFANNSAPRWGRFGEYLKYVARCFDLVKNYCEICELTWRPDSGDDKFTDRMGPPLTAEEIIWLLNEMGLAYYSEGAVQEAMGVWGLAFDWAQRFEGEDREQGVMYLASLYCHLGAANLELGRLDMAASHFEQSKACALESANGDLETRVDGYLARVEHLRGSVVNAERGYRNAIKKLRISGNKRAQCYFMRHYAELLIHKYDHAGDNRMADAEVIIRNSIAISASEDYPDFVAYSRELLAWLMLRTNRKEEAALEYAGVLKQATTMGMFRLEADALLGLATLQLELGDVTAARRRAISSLQIANRYLLAARQDRALVVLGKVSHVLGERELATAFLKLAREMAARHQFRLIEKDALDEQSRLDGTGIDRGQEGSR
jgi:tetratricopeptide (TPR) repeat protein